MTNQHNPAGSSWEDVWEYPEPVRPVAAEQSLTVSAPVAVPEAKQVAKRGPGRPPLPPEERARRRGEQKERYRLRAEAKRRAASILMKRHADEFDRLFTSLLESQSK